MARKKYNWRHAWAEEFKAVRDQCRLDWSNGMPPRPGMKRWSDHAVTKYAEKEASRRCERAIRVHNDKIELQGTAA